MLKKMFKRVKEDLLNKLNSIQWKSPEFSFEDTKSKSSPRKTRKTLSEVSWSSMSIKKSKAIPNKRDQIKEQLKKVPKIVKTTMLFNMQDTVDSLSDISLINPLNHTTSKAEAIKKTENNYFDDFQMNIQEQVENENMKISLSTLQ